MALATGSSTAVSPDLLRRAEELDALDAILPFDRRNQLAELLTDEDVATLKHLASEGMGANTMRALASDLAYLGGVVRAGDRHSPPLACSRKSSAEIRRPPSVGSSRAGNQCRSRHARRRRNRAPCQGTAQKHRPACAGDRSPSADELVDPDALAWLTRIRQAGLDPAQFSAHGLRSGYLTEAANRGVPLPEAMQRSLHKSVTQASGYYNNTERKMGRAARLVV
jgi:hypothetical protein